MQRNKLISWALVLFLLPLNSLAERTSGYCGMSEDEKGPEVLQLFPKVTFYSVPVSDMRNRIWLDAWVRTNDLYDGIRLEMKTKLFGSDRKIIGKVVKSFNPMKILEETDSLTHLVISGYLEKSCTDNLFIPEEELNKLLSKAENNEKLSFFEDYFAKFNFTKTKESAEYTSYVLVQPEFTKQVLEPRILMVFYRGELIAIFHTRDLLVKRYDSIEMGKEYKMIYNSKFSEHTKKEMVEIYKKKLN